MKATVTNARWANPWLLGGVVLVLSLALARSYPLLDPDEGRNAEVAREMVASHDFLVPRLAQMPYLDKPPGYFWAAALAIGVAGNRPWAVRLPAALAAAAIVWRIARLAFRRDDATLALRAMLLLAVAPLFAILSAYVIFDMPLTLCVTALWTALADECERGVSARRRLWMFIALTAGLLIKGPVMLAWALGGSLGAALLTRSRRPIAWLPWWPGWVVVAGVAGGWFALASQRHPEYAHYAFVEESLQRMTTGAFHREQPWWFVPVVLAAGALPWSIATPWTRRIGATSRVALGFMLFAAVFFTLSRSKLVTYLLPAMPPLAWLAGEAWTRAQATARTAWTQAALYAALGFALLWIARGGGAMVSAHLDAAETRATQVLAAALLALAALAVWAGRARRPSLTFAAGLAFLPLTLLIGGPALARSAASESGAPLARAIESAAPGARVRYEHCYSPGTDFLLGRDSELVSVTGGETTSNYQLRYRELLRSRGQWRVLDIAPDVRTPIVIVRPVRGGLADLPAGVEFFRDRRFVACYVPGADPSASTTPKLDDSQATGDR